MTHHSHPQYYNHMRHAIICAIIAYAAFSTHDAGVKILTETYPPGTIMMMNGGLLLLLSIGSLLYLKKISSLWQTPYLRLHLLRAVGVAGVSFLAIKALQTVLLHDFYGILFLSPFVLGILTHFILGEHLGVHRIIAMVVGFVGVLLMAGPEFAHFVPGYIYVLIMLFFVSFHLLITRKLGNRDPWPLFSFFPGLGMFTLGSILSVADGSLFSSLPAHIHATLEGSLGTGLSPLFLITGLCLFTAQVMIARAYGLTPLTSIVIPYVYTQMIWGTAYGYVLFGTIPAIEAVIGACLVITSGIGSLFYERHVRKKTLSAHALGHVNP